MAVRLFSGPALATSFAYALEKFKYPGNRYTMEVKRLLDILDRSLVSRHDFCGEDYNIADIATHVWYGALIQEKPYQSH